MTNDTTNTIIEHSMLTAHPLYVAAIAVVVVALFVGIWLINRKRGGTV